jgi:hypothetical protein
MNKILTPYYFDCFSSASTWKPFNISFLKKVDDVIVHFLKAKGISLEICQEVLVLWKTTQYQVQLPSNKKMKAYQFMYVMYLNTNVRRAH